MAVAEDVRQTRINVIRTYWDALMARDMKRFESLLADDVVIHYPGNHHLSGDYRGKKDVVALYTRLTEFVDEGVFLGEVLDIVMGEIYTAVVIRYDLKLPFKTIPGRAVGLFIIKDGKIQEYWLHEWDQVMINRVFRLTRVFEPLMRLRSKLKG